MGSYAAVWAGSSFAGMAHFPHVIVAALAAAVVGALWAGIAGLLKATVGANEVISTIMLNYTAIYVGDYLFGLGGPLQNDAQRSVPVSNDIVPGAKLHVFWGDPELQGVHIGIFVALAALVVFWVVLNRSTTGYEVRAVGLNPEAARYGGMSVARNYLLVMAVCGFFAGLAGAMDVLGWQFRIATNDIDISQIGFYGIAVALLGRNTAVGTLFAALLFGGLLSGTSQRNLDPTIFEPELASNLTTIIQGLVVLFVSADVLVIVDPALGAAAHALAAEPQHERRRSRTARARAHACSPRATSAWGAIALGVVAWFIALPPALVRSFVPSVVLGVIAIGAGAWVLGRGERRLGWGAIAAGVIGAGGAVARDAVGRRSPRGRRHVVRAVRRHAALRHAAVVRRPRRHRLRALRRREHRHRGHDADGLLLRHLRRRHRRLVGDRPARRDGRGRRRSRSCTRCSRSPCAPTRSSAASRSTCWRSASPATCTSTTTATRARPTTSRASPTSRCR